MKALILCAGFGSRLGELCKDQPKPLLSLGPRRIVEHILLSLNAAGIQEVFINLHYLAEQFPKVLGNGSRYGVKIEYCLEKEPRGTAGTPRDLFDAGRLGDEDLLVHYGDIVTDHSLAGLIRAHQVASGQDSLATILLHHRPGSNSHAYLGKNHRIERFIERPETPPEDAERSFAYSGVAILSRRCMAEIPFGRVVDLPRDLFPALANRGQLFGQVLEGNRFAIDSPARLIAARQAYANPSLSLSYEFPCLENAQ